MSPFELFMSAFTLAMCAFVIWMLTAALRDYFRNTNIKPIIRFTTEWTPLALFILGVLAIFLDAYFDVFGY